MNSAAPSNSKPEPGVLGQVMNIFGMGNSKKNPSVTNTSTLAATPVVNGGRRRKSKSKSRKSKSKSRKNKKSKKTRKH
jgi:hypothetical protein